MKTALLVSVVCVISACTSVDPLAGLPAFLGKKRADAVAELGEPARVDRFRMADAGPGEFRIGLQNTYPTSRPENYNVEIEELTWKDGDYWITLWLHQVNSEWVVLYALRWEKDMMF